MEFSRSMSILWRRWYLFVPALLLALLITAGVFVSVKPTYSAETVLLLEAPNPPALAVKGVVLSPYDNYGGLNTVAAIVSSAESSQARAAILGTEGVPATAYTVTPDPSGNTPELQVTATSTSPVVALQWDRIVAKDVRAYMHQFQLNSNATPSTFVTTNPVATPVKALKSDKSRIRVGVAVGVVTVLLALSLTLIFDSIMVQRSSRRRRATTLPVVATQSGDGEFYTGSIATMHGSDSRGRTSALRRP